MRVWMSTCAWIIGPTLDFSNYECVYYSHSCARNDSHSFRFVISWLDAAEESESARAHTHTHLYIICMCIYIEDYFKLAFNGYICMYTYIHSSIYHMYVYISIEDYFKLAFNVVEVWMHCCMVVMMISWLVCSRGVRKHTEEIVREWIWWWWLYCIDVWWDPYSLFAPSLYTSIVFSWNKGTMKS